MIQLEKALSRRRLSGSAAATRLGVTRPRVRALSEGRIELFTIDALVDMLARLGVRVGVVVAPLKRPAKSRLRE